MEILAFLGVLAVPLCIFLGILYFFFPLIVMSKLGDLQKQFRKLHVSKEHAAILESQTELLRELRTQNALTRQLLRAYGHDPES